MNFESALTAMKQSKSVRRAFHRYGRTRFYIGSDGRFVEYGDTTKDLDVTVHDNYVFDHEELLAEDWEVAEEEIEAITITEPQGSA